RSAGPSPCAWKLEGVVCAIQVEDDRRRVPTDRVEGRGKRLTSGRSPEDGPAELPGVRSCRECGGGHLAAQEAPVPFGRVQAQGAPQIFAAAG
ncbi:MAG: hypothetical protein L3K17_08235, partial [Thermoplasmata archaeon]|nr:hypothetical protein [Thermoplasmata archaeon]